MDNDKTAVDFRNLLFNPDEIICICPQAKHNGFFYVVKDMQFENGEFFVINPIKGGRSDSNVTAYRNILVEIDDMPLPSQFNHLKSLNMPYSTVVYSGGKSLHYIISLEESVSSKEVYTLLVRWIYNIINSVDPSKYVDEQNKNPARLSRFPNVIRTNKPHRLQRLIYVRERVKTDDLLGWLKSFPNCKPSNKKTPLKKVKTSQDRSKMAAVVDWYVEDYLNDSYQEKETNRFQCPLCAEEGRDTRKDNLAVTRDERYFYCFANDEHNIRLAKKLYSLKRECDLKRIKVKESEA